VIFLKKSIIYQIIIGLLAVLPVLTLFYFGKKEEKSIRVSSFYSGFTVVIDPGHGGEDSGAIGIDDVFEKDVNLKISRRLEMLFNLFGINTEVTRNEDVALCTDEKLTLRQRKNEDLKRRVNKITNISDAILISIHQNSFPEDKRCHGAQVFFSTNNVESDELAKHIQTVLTEKIDTTNKRVEKECPSSVFLMKNVNCPAVLVECGFLSNETDVAMLVDDSYQKKLAADIFSGFLKYKK